MRRIKSLIHPLATALVLSTGLAGCNAYRMPTPSGFAEVDAGDHGAHYKGSENVGLRVSTFDNVKGGTLAFWSEDLVRKLGARGYRLVGQTPAKSKNGVPGTRFDFAYQPPGVQKPEPRSYSVVLFVSDEHIVVQQLAGTPDAIARYDAQLGQIAASTKIRGCRVWTDICEGPQPGALSTPPADTEAKKDSDPPQPDTELASEGAPQGG